MLLPGTSAKLEPPEDCIFLDGEGQHCSRIQLSSATDCAALFRRQLLFCPHSRAGPNLQGRAAVGASLEDAGLA